MAHSGLSLRRIAAPDSLPVTLHEVKAHLQIEADDWDLILDGYAHAVTDYLDGRAGYLYRCLMSQTWVAELNGFPSCAEGIPLALGPVLSVDQIEYLGTDGVAQILAADAYEYFPADGMDSALIKPAIGQSWPVAYARRGSVKVTYKAGYANAAAVPYPIKAAILLMVGVIWRDRGDGEARSWQENSSAKALLSKYRRVSL